MALATEIKDFKEKASLTLVDVVLLAKAIQLEESRISRLLPDSAVAQGEMEDEEKREILPTDPDIDIESIKKAKKMLRKPLLRFRARYGEDLQKELSRYYVSHSLFPTAQSAKNTKKILDVLIVELEAEIVARNLKRFEERLSEVMKNFTNVLNTPPCVNADELKGVEEVKYAIKNLESVVRHPLFAELKNNQEAFSLLGQGNRRLYRYIECYLLHLVKIQHPQSLSIYKKEIDPTKNTIASIIQFIFKHNSRKVALEHLEMLIQSAAKNEGISQLYDICLSRISDPIVHKEFLNMLNRKFIEQNGLKDAYNTFQNRTNKTIRISLARAILSCKDISDAEAKKIAELKVSELMQLTDVLSPREAMDYITNNKYIAQGIRANLIEYLQNDGARKLKKHITQTAMLFIEAIEENSGASFLDAGDRSNDLLDILTLVPQAAEAKADEAKADTKEVMLAGLEEAIKEVNAGRSVKTSYSNCMEITANALKQAASKLEGSVHAKLSVDQKETSKESTLLMGPGLGLALRVNMRDVENTVVSKEGLIGIIHNFTGVLIEVDPVSALEHIETVFNILLSENKKEEETHVTEAKKIPAECVQAACDICLGQKNEEARFAAGRALLERHCANLSDAQIDAIIADLVRIPSLDKYKIYTIFAAQPDKNRARMAAAILRNSSMREWVISSSEIYFKEIFSSLGSYFRDAPDPNLERITNPEKHKVALNTDNQRRATTIKNAKKVFANWTNENFQQAASRDTARQFKWLTWGSLTRLNAGDLSDAELMKEVQKLDLTKLSPRQIRKLDKRSRIAILKSLGPWEVGKQKIIPTASFNANRFKTKADALTAGFTPDDIRELYGCETGLVVAFKNFPEEAANQIIAEPNPQRKAGWILLQEVDHGFYKGAEQGWLGNKKWLHNLIVASVYQYNPDDGYAVDGLEKNSLIEADLREKKADFLADEKTSADAYALILRSPAVIMSYAETKTISQRLSNWLKKELGAQTVLDDKNELQAFIISAARPCFGRPQCISPCDFLEAIEELNKGLETSQAAAKHLIGTIPLFLRNNRAYTSNDIEAMKILCDLYRTGNLLAKNKDENHYQEDPLVAALQANEYEGAGSAARNVLGYVLCSHPFFPRDKNCELISIPSSLEEKNLGDLEIKSKTAYVCHQEGVSYVTKDEKGKSKCINIGLTPAQLEQFKLGMKPAAQSRILKQAELKQITLLTGHIRQKPQYVLLKGYLKKQREYKIPESAVISWLRTFVWGMTIGAVTGLAVALYEHLTGGATSLWERTFGKSVASQLIDLAKITVGAGAAVATGVGIGATAAGFIAAAAVGAVTFGVLFVTGRAAWEGIKQGARSVRNSYRKWRELEVLGDGQEEYETLSSGLACMSLDSFRAMVFDKDPTNKDLREDLVRNILLMSDNGLDIRNNDEIPPEIRGDIQTLCERYRNKNTSGWLRAFDNVCSSIVWVTSCALTGILSTVGSILTLGRMKVQMWSPVTPPWLQEKHYQELLQTAQALLTQVGIPVVIQGDRQKSPKADRSLQGGTPLQLVHYLGSHHGPDKKHSSVLQQSLPGSVANFSAVGSSKRNLPEEAPSRAERDASHAAGHLSPSRRSHSSNSSSSSTG